METGVTNTQPTTMIKVKLLAGILLTLGIQGCKTYAGDHLPPTHLIFGNGGGFTGTVTEYILLENGQVFVRKGLNESCRSLGKVRKSEAKVLFKSWEAGSLAEEEFQHPGNIYYFVGSAKNGREQRLTWGSRDHPASEEMKAFYEKCTGLIKRLEHPE